MLKHLDKAVIFNEDIVFVNAHSDGVTSFSDNMVFINVDLNKVG